MYEIIHWLTKQPSNVWIYYQEDVYPVILAVCSDLSFGEMGNRLATQKALLFRWTFPMKWRRRSNPVKACKVKICDGHSWPKQRVEAISNVRQQDQSGGATEAEDEDLEQGYRKKGKIRRRGKLSKLCHISSPGHGMSVTYVQNSSSGVMGSAWS